MQQMGLTMQQIFRNNRRPFKEAIDNHQTNFQPYTTTKDRHPAHHKEEVRFWHALMVHPACPERGTHHSKEEDLHQHLEGQRVQCPLAHGRYQHRQHHQHQHPPDSQVAVRSWQMNVSVRSMDRARSSQMNQSPLDLQREKAMIKEGWSKFKKGLASQGREISFPTSLGLPRSVDRLRGYQVRTLEAI